MTATLLLWASAAWATAPPAQKIVDRWLQSKSLRGLTVAVSVVDTADGTVWAAHEAQRRLNPASGTKLLTTAAALHLLPMQTRWETRVHGQVTDGTVVGPLRLVGGGDPKLMVAHLERLAEAVVRAGAKAIPQGLVVHAGHFDDQGLPPAYAQKQTDAGYRPQVGAAAANFGAVRVTARPGKRRGDRVRVEVEGGAEAVDLLVEALTSRGEEAAVSITARAMEDGRTRIAVRGRLGQRARPESVRKRLFDPDRWTGAVLRAQLRARGVDVGAPLTVTREPLPEGAGPALATERSRSLPETLADINQWSNNFMAEMVLKQMGCAPSQACTWSQATERVTEALVALGVPETGFEYVNGSGLYRATTVSTQAMTTLLRAVADDPVRGPVFMTSLAVSGKPGTLRGRLLGKRTRGKVRGKTGTLDEVVSLSGYVPSRRGRLLAFSVVVNDATPKRTRSIRRAIDRLVGRLRRR